MSTQRFRWAWLLFKASRAEHADDYDLSLSLFDEADGIKPLPDGRRAQRALVLLRAQRLEEAQSALAQLRAEFKGSANPDRQYLRRWATATLALMRSASSQAEHEAKAAQDIPCSRLLRWRFPLPVSEQDDFEDWR
jgi:hypothetical protein